MKIEKLAPLALYSENGKEHLLKFDLCKGIYQKIACGTSYENKDGLLLFKNDGLVFTVFIGDLNNIHTFRGICEEDFLSTSAGTIIYQENGTCYSYNQQKELKTFKKLDDNCAL